MKAISNILHKGLSVNEASKAVILLHGRGGTARHMLGLVNGLYDNSYYVAIPQATDNTWYPQSFMAEKALNEPYLSNSIKEIYELIEDTAQHISRDQIFIVGFSQGACLSIEITARFAAKYGGVVAFTGGLVGSTLDHTLYQGDFKGTKIFMSNGDQDPYIPLIRSQESQKVMEKLGAAATLKVYPGRPHIISEDEINEAAKILASPN